MKTATCFQDGFLLPPTVPKAPDEAPTLQHAEEVHRSHRVTPASFSFFASKEGKVPLVSAHSGVFTRVHSGEDKGPGLSPPSQRLSAEGPELAWHPPGPGHPASFTSPHAHGSRWSGSSRSADSLHCGIQGGTKIRQPQPAEGKTCSQRKRTNLPQRQGLLTTQTPRLKVCLICCCFYNASINIFCFKNCFGFLAGTCTLLISTYLKLYDQSF